MQEIYIDQAVQQPVPVGISEVPEKPLYKQLTWWVLVFPLLMFVGIFMHNIFIVNFTHVISGALWTGVDIVMGFIIGPILRKLRPDQRKAFINWFVPKIILYIPILAFTTGTAGWTMASWMGMISPSSPDFTKIVIALIIITILAISGFGFLLPNQIRTYLELKKPQPDIQKVFRLNSRNNIFAGIQGVFQVAIILVMAMIVM